MKNIKNLILGSILLSLTTLAHADKSVKNEQAEHPYTQLCKAALKSEQEFLAKARELRVGKAERNRLVCNNMTVEDFAANYRITEESSIATVQ